jgi:hypothetical protein
MVILVVIGLLDVAEAVAKKEGVGGTGALRLEL